jgi:hypothetical protein
MAVAHEAEQFFVALRGGEADCQDPESNRTQQERDARFLEQLRLKQWQSNQGLCKHVSELENRCKDVERELGQTQVRLIAAERARYKLGLRLIDAASQLIAVQEREIQTYARNEQLRSRLERFEAHPLLGPVLRGRRLLLQAIQSTANGLGRNGGAVHHGDFSQ